MADVEMRLRVYLKEDGPFYIDRHDVLQVLDRLSAERIAKEESCRALQERVLASEQARAAAEAERGQARDANRKLHRRAQEAESEENERTKPLREKLDWLLSTRKWAREWMESRGANWSNGISEFDRAAVTLLVEDRDWERQRAEAAEKLAADRLESWKRCEERLSEAERRIEDLGQNY